MAKKIEDQKLHEEVVLCKSQEGVFMDEHSLPEEDVLPGETKLMMEVYPPYCSGKRFKRRPSLVSPRQWINRVEAFMDPDEQWDIEECTPIENIPDFYHSRAYTKEKSQDGDYLTYVYSRIYKYVPETTTYSDEFFKYLKAEIFDNIVALTAKTEVQKPTLQDAIEWNHYYLIDYDGTWIGGTSCLKSCLHKLYEIFPNAFLVMPSIRSGIHLAIYSSSADFNVEEYLTYSIVGYNIIKDYFKFNAKVIEEQVCDSRFLTIREQLFALNPVFYIETNRYCVNDYAYARDYPKAMREEQWRGMKDNLDPQFFKSIFDFIMSKLQVSQKHDNAPRLVCEKIKKSSINIAKDGKFFINRNFTIAGVPFHGNDLRWRIVKIIYDFVLKKYKKKGSKKSVSAEDSEEFYNIEQIVKEEAKQIIQDHFSNADEMLRCLNTVAEYQKPNNKLITIWVIQNILMPKVTYTHTITLDETSYIPKYTENIMSALKKEPVYIASAPGTGKTELAKNFLGELERVIVVVHQNSIKDSKFRDSKYAYEKGMVKKLLSSDCNTPPSKMVLIWDQFVKVYNHFANEGFDWSSYTFIFDESHNLVTQLGFRSIIFKLSDIIPKLKHVLLMTGTPVGESCILPNCTSFNFKKSQKTKYTFHPIHCNCGSTDIMRKERQYIKQTIERRGYDLTIIYDNYNHKRWVADFPNFVHYYKQDSKSTDVRQINQLSGTDKKGIICTCYMSEGIDITSKLRGIKRGAVIVNLDRFVNPHEVEQIIHRFRDAQEVDVFLCSHTDKVAHSLHIEPTEIEDEVLSIYIYNCSMTSSSRNYLYEMLMGLPSGQMSHQDYQMLQNESHPINFLISLNGLMAQTPLSIYSVQCMRDYSEDYEISDIQYVDLTDHKTNKSIVKRDTNFDNWVKTNVSKLNQLTRDEISTCVDELDGKYLLTRTQIFDHLETLYQLSEWYILKDCLDYFVNQDNSIKWTSLSTFIKTIEIRDKHAKGFCYQGVNLCPHITQALEKSKAQIEELASMLNFRIDDSDRPFRELVWQYKFGYSHYPTLLSNAMEKNMEMIRECDISIFRMNHHIKKASNVKPITIRNKSTGVSYTYSSQNECMTKQKFGRVNLSNLIKGMGKLCNDWEVVLAS